MRSPTDRKRQVVLLMSALIVLVIAGGPPNLQAAQMTADQVRSAVETWVRHVTADARPEAFVVEMQPYQADGRTVGYIAHLSGGGFCLCGADDLVLPVYFYSPRGTYDPESSGCRYILREIGNRSKSLREGLQKGDTELYRHQNALSDRAALWQDLASGRMPRRLQGPKEDPTDIEPDLLTLDVTSHWHQGSPYNDECPELTPGEERVDAGPMALAMAQIMYYWKWPHSGEGTGSVDYKYRWRANWAVEDCDVNPGIPADPLWEGRLVWVFDDKKDGGELFMRGYWDESLYLAARDINTTTEYRDALKHLWDDLDKVTAAHTADFSAGTYDWSIMEDSHSDPPDAGAAEAAKICYDAGVASKTTYGLIEASADPHQATYAYKDHFRYDDDVREGSLDIDEMTEEIAWYRPMVMSGKDPDQNEHAWVVYGYNKGTDPDRQFLVNMGLGGDDDGWYTCDNIDYYLDQKQVDRIAPETVVQFVYQEGAKPKGAPDGSPDNPYTGIDEALATVPDSVTLIFKAGTDMPLTEDVLIIDRPIVLKGKMVLGE